jgi:glycopeptide antibiotics resistance protein
MLTLYPLDIYRLWNFYEVNLVPVSATIEQYRTLSMENGMAYDAFIRNFIGNLILFLPLGFLLPSASPRLMVPKNIFVVFLLLSATIEIMQLVLRGYGIYRTVDIDDVILNTLGGMVGFGLFRTFHRD